MYDRIYNMQQLHLWNSTSARNILWKWQQNVGFIYFKYFHQIMFLLKLPKLHLAINWLQQIKNFYNINLPLNYSLILVLMILICNLIKVHEAQLIAKFIQCMWIITVFMFSQFSMILNFSPTLIKCMKWMAFNIIF